MQENILLMFLSDIKARDGEILKTHYTNLEGEDTHATNESAVRWLLQNNSEGATLSKIFIIASETVREKNIQNYSEQITHLEYFKNRLKKFLPDIENIITEETIYKYNENNGGTENLKSVAETAEKIQNFAKDKTIILHADLTGGMRHINMMMLDIIRLLEYSGIKIGKIIYSNFATKRVEEVKNIYDLFQLISGVEEFINFGSVKVLQEYYKNQTENISANLQNLLDAMKNFAEAIKLCRYGQFKNSVEKLHDAINDFSADENNLNDILMSRLIERIKQEYKMLIATRGVDDLKIIRWCVEKGYLQQALTLYTERIPEYVGEKIFYTIPPQEYKKLQEKIGDDKRSEAFYFLNNYLTETTKKTDKDKTEIEKEYDARVAELKNFQTEIDNSVNKINNYFFEQIRKFVVPAIRNKNFNYEQWREKIFTNIKLPVDWISAEGIFTDEEKLRAQLELLIELRKNPATLKENLADKKLEPIRDIIKELSGKFEVGEKGFERFRKILKLLETSNLETLKNFLPSFECKAQILRLQFMLDKKIFSLNVDRKIFLSIMDRYFCLKDERNHSNHARNDIGEFETAQDLENFILDGLDEIEKIIEE